MMVDMPIDEVLDHLPHRYPFLLIDRVLRCIPGKSLVALKNVTINEPFFPGHFPRRPVMPAVLILEAMAQATGILALRSLNRRPSATEMYYFVGVDNARFRHPVEPGDQLFIEIDLVRTTRGIWKVAGRGKVEERVVAAADFLGALRDKKT